MMGGPKNRYYRHRVGRNVIMFVRRREVIRMCARARVCVRATVWELVYAIGMESEKQKKNLVGRVGRRIKILKTLCAGHTVEKPRAHRYKPPV